MERIEHRACFGGWQDVYRHHSTSLGCAMQVGAVSYTHLTLPTILLV